MAYPPDARLRLARLATSVWQRARPHLWLAPVLVVAAWLRLVYLGSETLYGDEAEYAIVARYLSRDLLDLSYPALNDVRGTAFVSQPPLILYMMAFAMRAMGPTDAAAILPSALLGVATVAVAYALGCRLGGRLHGLVASALVAVLPFHVSMSRNAMLDVGFAFFMLLTAHFLVAWTQERAPRYALLAGFAAAGAALSKLPGVLAVPLVVAVLGVPALLAVARYLAHRCDAPAVRAAFAPLALALVPIVVGAAAYVAVLGAVDGMDPLARKLEWQFSRVSGESESGRSGISYYFTDRHASFEAQLGSGVYALSLVGLGFALFRVAVRPRRSAHHAVVPLMTLLLAAFFLLSSRKIAFYLLPFAPVAGVLVGAAAAGVRDMIDWAGIRLTPRLAARAGPAAVAVALAIVAMPAYGAASQSYDSYATDDDGSTWGFGIREAAWWIGERDGESAQYGTLLGRFTLLWYNEQPTYHWFVNHTKMKDAVQKGELRYVVFDEYLDLDYDREFMGKLIAEHGGVEVARFEREWAVVRVFQLQPGPPTSAEPCPWMAKRIVDDFAC